MSEINGFEIDVYNQYEFKDGAKTSTCPICSEARKKKNDKCLSLNWDNGLGSCHHCGEMIQIHTFKKKPTDKEYLKPPPLSLKLNLSDKVSKYLLYTRGLKESALKRLKITDGVEWMPQTKKEENCIQFNYYLEDELINIKYRDGHKNFKMFKDARKVLYNIDALRFSTEAIITEGEMDVLSFVGCGFNHTVSVPNGATISKEEQKEYKKTGKITNPKPLNLDYIDESYEYIKHIEKWYVCVDEDGAGWKLKKELIRRFGAENCYIVDFNGCKDANEYLKQYGCEGLTKVIEEAKPVPLEGVISINDTWEDLVNFWTNGASKGYTIGLTEMDKYCSFIMQQYTLLVSAPNAGKSDKIDDIACRLALKYGDKTAFVSVENQPYYLHQNKWFRRILGRTPKAHEVNEPYIFRVKEFIDSHFIHVHNSKRFELRDVLSKFKELVKRKGVRYFVIDPYNKIYLKGVSKKDINEYTSEYHMLLDEFVKENDCHIFLVAHPTKISYEEGTKSFQIPNAYQVKGGGEHFDMSYNIIGMSKDNERGAVRFQTLKWKFDHLGTSGKEWFEMWNINNGRYTDIDGDYTIDDHHTPTCIWDNSNWLGKEEQPEINYNQLPVDPRDLEEDYF